MREIGQKSVIFSVSAFNKKNSKKREKPWKHWVFKAFECGGGCGIRTHVTLLSNGFQDHLVMTASITLRIWNCFSAGIIGYLIFLDIWLDVRFFADFGVPEKSGVARLSAISASVSVARFQDRLVMTASITLRRLSFAKCSAFWREFRERTMKFLCFRKCRKPL